MMHSFEFEIARGGCFHFHDIPSVSCTKLVFLLKKLTEFGECKGANIFHAFNAINDVSVSLRSQVKCVIFSPVKWPLGRVEGLRLSLDDGRIILTQASRMTTRQAALVKQLVPVSMQLVEALGVSNGMVGSSLAPPLPHNWEAFNAKEKSLAFATLVSSFRMNVFLKWYIL